MHTGEMFVYKFIFQLTRAESWVCLHFAANTRTRVCIVHLCVEMESERIGEKQKGVGGKWKQEKKDGREGMTGKRRNGKE